MNIQVRKATIYDAEKIVTLLIESQWFTYADLYSKEYIEEMIAQYYSLERIKKEITSVTNEWHGYYIATSNHEVIGVIGGGMAAEHVGEIYIFYVQPSIIGNGIGTRLLHFYTKIQKHHFHATQQQVLVAKGNTKGIPFYEAKGFTFIKEQPTYGSSSDDNDLSLKYMRSLH